MKKLIYLLAVALTFSMAACDDNKGKDNGDDDLDDEIDDVTYVDYIISSANFA